MAYFSQPSISKQFPCLKKKIEFIKSLEFFSEVNRFMNQCYFSENSQAGISPIVN